MSPLPNTPQVSQEQLLRDSEHVSRLVYGMVGNTAIADDILQEAWLRALEKPPAHAASLAGWWSRVARNLAIDWFRREGKFNRHKDPTQPDSVDAKVDPSFEASRAETSYLLLQAVRNLTEPYRTAVTLHYIDGLAVSEVGRQTGVPTSTVRTQLMRGRQRLEVALDQNLGSQWRAGLLATFPGIAQFLPPAAPGIGSVALAKAEVGTASVSQGGSGMVVAAASTLLVVAGLTWIWVSEPEPVAVTGDVSPIAVQAQTAAATLDPVAARVEYTNASSDPSIPPRLRVSNLAGILQGDIQVQAIEVAQIMYGAALDAPIEALSILDQRNFSLRGPNYILPAGLRDGNWVLDLSAPDIATERILYSAGIQSELDWSPLAGREFKIQAIDPGGVAIANVLVFAGGFQGSPFHPVQFAFTDGNGWAHFSNLPLAERRFLALHPEGGFVKISEAQAMEIGRPSQQASIPLLNGPGFATGLSLEKILASAFPYGVGAGSYPSFLTLVSNFVFRQNRIEIVRLSNELTAAEAPYLTKAWAYYADGTPARNASVLVQLSDETDAQARTDATGRLQFRSKLPIAKLAILGPRGFHRRDEITASDVAAGGLDLGNLVLFPYTHADVQLTGSMEVLEIEGGLSRPREMFDRPQGPVKPVAQWSQALLKASQWLKPFPLGGKQLRFLGPGVDTLGIGWVQVNDGFARAVELCPGGVVELALDSRATVRILSEAPLGEPGTQFNLVQNKPTELFVGVRPDGSHGRILSAVLEDGKSLLFEDVPPGNYSLDTQPVAVELFTMGNFEVQPGYQEFTVSPPEKGVLLVEVPLELRGNTWMRLNSFPAVERDAPQSTGRMPLGWEPTLSWPLEEGNYSMVIQTIHGVPKSQVVHVNGGQTTTIRLDGNNNPYVIRAEADDVDQIESIMFVLEGKDRLKWAKRRALVNLPSGGVLSTNINKKHAFVLAYVMELDDHGCVTFHGLPSKPFLVLASNKNNIWSEPVSVDPASLKEQQENPIGFVWPPSVILQHPQDWGKWTSARVSGTNFIDQPLDPLTRQTELPLTAAGDFIITIQFVDAEDHSATVELPVTVIAGSSEAIYLPISIPVLERLSD